MPCTRDRVPTPCAVLRRSKDNCLGQINELCAALRGAGPSPRPRIMGCVTFIFSVPASHEEIGKSGLPDSGVPPLTLTLTLILALTFILTLTLTT